MGIRQLVSKAARACQYESRMLQEAAGSLRWPQRPQAVAVHPRGPQEAPGGPEGPRRPQEARMRAGSLFSICGMRKSHVFICFLDVAS